MNSCARAEQRYPSLFQLSDDQTSFRLIGEEGISCIAAGSMTLP